MDSVGFSHLFGLLCHTQQCSTFRIVQQVGQPFWGKFALQQQSRCVKGSQPPGIGALVVIDGIGRRYKHGGCTHGSDFYHSACACATDNDMPASPRPTKWI